MYKVLVKRHAETRRFKDEGHRWHNDDTSYQKMMRYVGDLVTINYQVQIKAEDASGWYELRTILNTRNNLIH